jgi:deoxyribodipyrimidine photo-lyase
LLKNGTTFETFKDQVVFEKSEVVKDDGKPYTVFTPYSRKWKSRLTQNDLQECNTQQYVQNFLKQPEQPLPSIESIGFVKTGLAFPSKIVQNDIIKHYTENRNFPGIANSTSKMGVHLRFGTISIRQLAKVAQQLNETYLNELIWRDFYHAILWHFPKVGMGQSFKSDYDRIQWRNNEVEFARWCDGNTGYPIVDAGMRELNATGFMHNRVRMIVASFLTKHLLIDWRWGEAYFAQKLLDFDLAANNGGWQWASGSGCDAAPYFRVFNPYLQTEKFDKSLTYIKKWVPEFQELTYAQPIIIHEVARKRVLETYAKALKGA